MKTNEINVGIVGTQFMGRAHSNAYLDVPHFFDLPAPPVLSVACDTVGPLLVLLTVTLLIDGCDHGPTL